MSDAYVFIPLLAVEFCLVGLEVAEKGSAQKWEVEVAAVRFGDQER